MRRTTASAAVLGLVTAVLAVVALWGAIDNPSLDDTSYGVPHTCLAPWDTVLNDADNWPGGDQPADAADIAARCRAAGEQRFSIARGAGLAAAGTALGAIAAGAVAAVRRARPHAAAAPAR